LAEPRASAAHIPVLMGICAVGAIAFGALPHFLKLKRMNPWVASVILVILFLALIAPTIMVIGSILATGRTM
jgi:predicted PurR-regulated permease PerM